MHIKKFSAQTGLSADTLRYYEKEGLLQPARDENGYRVYGERDIDWVGFILKLKAMSVPLADIKEYARLRHLGDATVPERFALLQKYRQRLQEQQRELAEHQTLLENKLAIYRRMMGQE